MDVTLPNGKVISGVPEGTPKDVIKQKAIAAGLASESDFPSETSYQEVDREAATREQLAAMNQDIGPFDAAMIAAGRTMMQVPRSLGLAEPEPEIVTQAYRGLEEQRPIATGVGTALPFVAPGMGIGAIPSIGGRVLAGGALGAGEGAIVAEAGDSDALTGAGVGGAIGAGFEVLFPILGRLSRSVYSKLTGTVPEGQLLDAAGNPVPEFQRVLDDAGVKFSDLIDDAQALAAGAKEGADPEQVARLAMFEQQGVPISKGELTKEFKQQAVEQRLMESAADSAAEPFRQFKLRQSESVKAGIERGIDTSAIPEQSGDLIKDALIGRKKLLQTQKNALYKEAAENARDVGGLPVMVDVEDVLPNELTTRGLNRASNGAVEEINETLVDFGLLPPSQAQIEAGFVPETLTVENFDDLRQTLKAIARKDQSGAAEKYLAPITSQLDTQLDEIGAQLEKAGYDKSITEPLKAARLTVRQLKTEYSPQAIIGKLVDTKRDGVTNVIEASKVYDKMAGRALPVEDVRRIASSLAKSGEKGEQALASIQSTVMLDLLDAGFGTKSRQISGVQVFNPIAFRNRIDSIGQDKLKAIFKNNTQGLNKLMTFDKIAKELTPSAATMPKGSASVIGDYLNRLGLIAVGSKIPGGEVLMGHISRLAQSGGDTMAVKKAMQASPEIVPVVRYIDQRLPGLAAALGIAGLSESEQNEAP